MNKKITPTEGAKSATKKISHLRSDFRVSASVMIAIMEFNIIDTELTINEYVLLNVDGKSSG